MFTGLISRLGQIRAATLRGTGLALSIALDRPWPADDPICLGESIAVNGACLTVTGTSQEGFDADVLAETLRCTTFAQVKVGQAVNLERALKVGDRLGGHYVSGHIDEVGTIAQIRPTGDDYVYRMSCSRAFAHSLVHKGSVALAGISLTISALGDDWFEVSIIPTTRRETILATLAVGDALNLEADILGKYAQRQAQTQTVTWDKLESAGFI